MSLTNNANIAREVFWTYRGIAEEETEHSFFAALEDEVASEIEQRISGSQRIWVGREIHLRVGAYTIQARLTNVDPILATLTDASTRFTAQYHERSPDEGQDISTFVSEIIRFPNERMGATYGALVGLDAIKADMMRKLTLLLNPAYLQAWITDNYAENPPQALLRVLRDRYPLIVLEGEVGSGKTALARSIGHWLAIDLKPPINLALFIVNAQVRGGGHVGELTQNISRAFTEAERCQEREQIPVLILIDEADALAQARGGRQTHHEDDAGVNTLIQRIDRLRGKPMAVIFATNMVQSLDAAILRRAIATYHFDRPQQEQRAEAFTRLLAKLNISEKDIARLALLTEPRKLPGFGTTTHRYTYSDISQRIIPYAIEEALYRNQPLRLENLDHACMAVLPTPERQEEV